MREITFEQWVEKNLTPSGLSRVGILSVTPAERRAVRDCFTFKNRVTGSAFTVMETGHLETSRGTDLEIIHVSEVIEEQGRMFGSEMFDKIADNLDLRLLLLVGIAGGFPIAEFTLGDVIIPSSILDLTRMKVRSSATSPKFEQFVLGEVSEGSREAIVTCGALSETEPNLDGWNSELIGDVRPHLEVDPRLEQNCSEWYRKRIDDSLKSRCPDGYSEAHPRFGIGEVISADVNNKDPDLAEEWMKRHEDVVANEMELGGIMRSIKRRKEDGKPVPSILPLKAISDIPGFVKNDTHVNYACACSAKLAKSIVVKSGIFDPDNSAPEQAWTTSLPDHVLRYQALPPEMIEKVMQAYTSIFRAMADGRGCFATPVTNVFRDVWEQLLETSGSGRMSSIEGPPGTGKTTFLALLALYASTKLPDNVHIDYVNLHELDELQPKTSISEYGEAASKKLIDWASTLQDSCKGETVFLFADGLDDYSRDRVPGIQARFRQQLNKLNAVHVVGIGRLVRDSRERRLSADVPDASPLAAFNPVAANDSNDLCEAFVQLKRLLTGIGLARHDSALTNIRQMFIDLRIDAVDLLMLDVAYNWQSTDFPNSDTELLFKFLRKQAGELLFKSGKHFSKPLDKATLDELFRLARIVYAEEVAEIQHAASDTDRALAIGWGLFVAHPRIRRFLLAYYICHALDAAFDSDSALIERSWREARLSGKVFPAEVNRHCKCLMNGTSFPRMCDSISKIVRRRLEEATETITLYQVEDGSIDEGLRLLAPHIDIVHLVYLLGRISVPEKAQQAVGLLYSLYSEYVTRIGRLTETGGLRLSKDLKTTFLKLNMLQCTIIISRVYADDENTDSATEDYVRFLLRHDWCDMAKGFHLEYHEDEEFQYDFSRPERAEKDSLRPFPNCLNSMLNAQSFAQIGERSRGIHIATLCALALARIGDEEAFNEPGQRDCLDRMNRFLSEIGELTGALNSLVAFTRRALSLDAHLHPSSITFLMMRSDQHERSGQIVDLKAFGCRAESVAEHTYNAMVLAERILPESLSEAPGEYDKGEVLRMILAHDFPECVTGDWRYDDCTDQVKKRWFGVAESLQWSVLLGAGEFGFFKRWVAVERTYETSLNATCAWFCDKLQLLMQLFRIRQLDENIDLETWVVFVREVLSEIRSVNSDHPFVTRMVSRTVAWFGLTKEELISNSNHVTNSIRNGGELFSDIEVYNPRTAE